MKQSASATVILLCILAASCHKSTTMQNARRDIHSYSNPEQIRVRHLDLDCDVLFDRKILKGTAVLAVERRGGRRAPPLVFGYPRSHTQKVQAPRQHGGELRTQITLCGRQPL